MSQIKQEKDSKDTAVQTQTPGLIQAEKAARQSILNQIMLQHKLQQANRLIQRNDVKRVKINQIFVLNDKVQRLNKQLLQTRSVLEYAIGIMKGYCLQDNEMSVKQNSWAFEHPQMIFMHSEKLFYQVQNDGLEGKKLRETGKEVKKIMNFYFNKM